MSFEQDELQINENFEKENVYTNNFADEYGKNEDNVIEKDLIYNEEEEIVSSLESEDEGVSIKLDDEEARNSDIKSEGLEESNKDIFIDNLENIEEDRSWFGNEDKFNELLFCCQNIGKYIDEGKTKYEKNEFCESNLRDIHRMLVKEDAEFPQKKFHIMKWKIIENDIIPLIISYPENHRVQLLSFVILVDMTQTINENCQHKQTINQYLTSILSYMSNHEVFFKHLGNLISAATIQLREAESNRKDLLKENINIDDENNMAIIPKEKKETLLELKRRIAEVENKYQQLIELIFNFLKQIFNVYNPQECWKNCEINLNFIKKMFENKIFDAINYHTTNFETEFYKRISFNFLELLHFIFREFTVTQLFEVTNKIQENVKSDSLLKRLRDDEKRQQQERLSKLSTRHNNFGTSIQIKRPDDSTSFMVTNVTTLFNGGAQDQIFDFQKKKPKGRYANKKYVKEINEEIKFLNDFKIKENFILDPSNGHILISLRQFCTTFIEISFVKLTKYIFEEIVSQSDRIEKYDIYYFFSVLSFLLEFHRYMEHDMFDKDRQKAASAKKKPVFKINLGPIRELIKNPLLELSYKIVFEQSMITKISDRKIFEFYSSLRFIKNILMLSIDIHKLNTDDSFNLNVIIQDSVLSRDYIRILKYGFAIFNPSVFPQQLLYDMIEFIELYFYCLETYSKVRKLMIKEKKKKRRNRDDENEEKELIKLMKEKKENDSFIEKNSENEDSKEDQKESSISFSSDDYDYKEREVDLKNEIRIVVDYNIISKILYVLSEYKNIKSSNLLRIIAKLFIRIIETDNTWIFYNIEFLNVFHKLLNDSIFKNNLLYKELYDCINQILKKFFSVFKTNKLLLVESLFKFNSAIIKDEILNNYEVHENNDNYLYVRQDLDIEKERIYGEDVNNDENNPFFTNDFDKKKEKNKNEDEEIKEKWTKNEDLLLIENYLKFKEIDNYMEILEGLFIKKKKKDIKKRIKKLKLKKGEAKAMKRLKKLHKNDKNKEDKENHVSISLNKENLFNIIIDLSDKCKDEHIKTNMDKTLTSLKQQLQTYNLRKDLLSDLKEDFQIIPKTEEEVEILRDNKFQNFIKNLGFVLPSDKSNMNGDDYILNQNIIVEDKVNTIENEYWKLPKNNQTEIEILIEKLDNFQKAIAENIVIPIPKKEEKHEMEITIDLKGDKESYLDKKKQKKQQSEQKSLRKKNYIEEEENTYKGEFKEPSIKESKMSKKESIIVEEMLPPKKRKLKKARIDDDENI